jgi:hypothetical protein
MKYNLQFICITVGLATLAACSETPKTETKAQATAVDTVAKKVEVIEIDSTLTRMSKLIAGLDTVLNYSHPQWNTAAIKTFAAETDAKYSQMRTNRLEKLAAWHTTNLKSASVSDSSFAFYPFSGGDFIHLRWLYPNATDYLMVAREEVGSYPDINTINEGEVMTYLQGVDMVLRDIYSKSYFITKNMITDIHSANRVDGMLPILLWGAAKTNLEIISIDFFDIDSLGNTLLAVDEKYDGVVLTLKDPVANKRKSLTYLSVDISDKGFTAAPGVSKYLDQKVPAGCNSFVKSASYLMHYVSFGGIRDIVLNKSNCLVQDDTGIPFKYFDQSIWNVNLFGEYEIPVKDFSSNLFQNDMNAAYKDSTIYKGPINFSLGYHWGSGNQNQMFSFKKNQIR